MEDSGAIVDADADGVREEGCSKDATGFHTGGGCEDSLMYELDGNPLRPVIDMASGI